MTQLSAASETKPNATLDLTEAIDQGIKRARRLHPLRTRYPRMDRICKPQRENFWVIGGRPGAFKTALLWNLALNCAENRQRVLFVTLEMTPGEMSLLAAAKFSGIARNRIADALAKDSIAPFSPNEQETWDKTLARLSSLMLYMRIHGAAENGRAVNDVLRSACRFRFDAVFVDHLGMIGRDGGGRELDVLSDAIHRLRGLSRGEVVKDYQPWVVATSQLNREIDKGDEDRIPRLSDFRGSSRIEHDADVAIGLQKRRSESAPEDDPTSLLDGFVLKNRNGVAPAVLLFEANGATGLVTERRKPDEEHPHHWQDTDEREGA